MTLRAHRHFETTPTALVVCWRCRRPTLYGLVEGVVVRADFTPLDRAAEDQALAAGRHTYTVRRSGLIHRDASRRADPALATPVVAQHRCRRPA